MKALTTVWENTGALIVNNKKWMNANKSNNSKQILRPHKLFWEENKHILG